MKTTLFSLLLFCSVQVIAQHSPKFRFNAYTNYVFDDHVDSYYSTTSYYDGTIKGGFQWGLGFEYMLHNTYGIELVYYRQDTKAPTNYFDDQPPVVGANSKNFNLGINYILIGGTRYFPVKPSIEPYFGINLGAAFANVSNPDNGNSSNVTKFAWGIKGGLNLWGPKAIGIKLQVGLTSATQAAGGTLYFGSGGVSSGLSSYSTIYQFALGGGLVFRFGGK